MRLKTDKITFIVGHRIPMAVSVNVSEMNLSAADIMIYVADTFLKNSIYL
jgi:hypothetical protein